MAPLLSVPACSLAEFVSRLSAALMNVHDLPAAIRPRSRSFSSNVQRILGITHHFFAFSPHLAGVISTFWPVPTQELVAREVKVSGQDQQRTRRSLSVTGQLPPFLMRVFAIGFENSLDLSVKRSIHAHFRE
jgi:hypothetical protein